MTGPTIFFLGALLGCLVAILGPLVFDGFFPSKDPWTERQLAVPFQQRAWLLAFAFAVYWPMCTMFAYILGGGLFYMAQEECPEVPESPEIVQEEMAVFVTCECMCGSIEGDEP